MSNKLRKTSKGGNVAKVTMSHCRQVMGYVQQLFNQLAADHQQTKTVAMDGSIETYNTLCFLKKKGVIDEEEYNAFVIEQDKKVRLAHEIRNDKSLGREGKLAKAKENDIPVKWVVKEEEPESEEEPMEEETPEKK